MQAKKIELIKAIKEIELIEVIELVKVRNWGNLACFNCTSQNVKEQNDTTINARLCMMEHSGDNIRDINVCNFI